VITQAAREGLNGRFVGHGFSRAIKLQARTGFSRWRVQRKVKMRFKLAIAALLFLFVSAQGAFAQGCALCYTSASAIGRNAERSLDIGILTLLAPALILFAAVVFLLYRRAVSATA
jgi:hypothetical protein